MTLDPPSGLALRLAAETGLAALVKAAGALAGSEGARILCALVPGGSAADSQQPSSEPRTDMPQSVLPRSDLPPLADTRPLPRQGELPPIPDPKGGKAAGAPADVVRRYLGDVMDLRKDAKGWAAERLPGHFPILPERQMRAFATGLLARPRPSTEVDAVRLVRAIAMRRFPDRLPTRQKASLTGGAVIYLDAGVGMQLFTRDARRFAELFQRMLGRQRCRILTITPAGRIPALPPGAAVALMLTDGHGFAHRHSYLAPGSQDWHQLVRTARARGVELIALCPGALGEVPRFADPDLIDGPHAPLRAVPWQEGLTPSQAAAYATGRQRARQRDHLAPMGKLQPNRGPDRLLALVSAQHDLDAASLRALRLCLADPARVAREMTPRPQRPLTVPAAAFPTLAPLDELALWTSRYIEIRDGRGGFAERIEEARQFRRAHHKAWEPLLDFAATVSKHMRAGRSVVELVGDRWQRDRLSASPSNDARKDLGETLQAIEEADGTAARAAQVTGGRGAGRRVSILPDGDRAMVLCIRASDGGRLLHLAEDLPECDLKITLPLGCDLATGQLALWDHDGAAPAAIHPLWPLDRFIEVDPLETGQLPRTLAITIGGRRYFTNLAARRSKMEPLFTTSLPRGAAGALQFQNGRLMLGHRQFEIEGLKLLNPEAEVEPTIGPAARMAAEGRLIAGDADLGGREERSIDLPRAAQREIAPVAAIGGNAIAVAKDRAWTVLRDPRDETADCTIVEWSVDHWRQDNTQRYDAGKVRVAASGLGGLVALRMLPTGVNALLLLDPSQKVSQRFLLQTLPDAIAMDDAGYVAVRSGTRLEIHQPLATLPSGDDGAATQFKDAGPSSVGEAKRLSQSTAKWYPAEEHDVLATVEALGSPRWEAATIIYRFARRDADKPPLPPERIASTYGLRPVDAQMISACLGPDPEADALLQAIQDGADPNLRLPGGMTPLQLCSNLSKPLEAVEVLLAAGARVDAADPFGRDSLYSAGFATDGGRTLERLLNAGADPRRIGRRSDPNGGTEDLTVGILAGAMFLKLGRREEHPPESLVLRLHEAGASWTAFANGARNSALSHAATRGPRLFDLALEHDGRVNLQNDEGWSPLLVAAWAGNTYAARRLIERKATPDLTLLDGSTALSLAAGNGHAEITAMLLEAGADPNGRETEYTPLDRIVLSNEDRPDPETAAVIAGQLVDHGIAFQRATFLRKALVGLRTEPREQARAFAIAGMLCRAGKSSLLVDSLAQEPGLDVEGWLAAFLKQVPLDLDAEGADRLRLAHVIAARATAPGMMDLLDQAGADLLAQDDHGNTPLHYAIRFGNDEAAKALRHLHPHMASIPRKDGLLAEQLHPEPPTRGFPAPPQTTAARPPSDDALAALSYLPEGTAWLDLFDAAAPVFRPAGLLNPALPFAARSTERWMLVALRQAALPYSVPTFLREGWWRRSDGALAIGAEVVSEAGEVIFPVRGRSVDIHAMNPATARGLQIDTPEAAAQYLRFFCHATHGENGPFILTESARALRWFGFATGPEQNAALRKDTRAERWLADRTVTYSSGLFRATFALNLTGEAEMLEDNALEQPASSRSFLADGGLFCFSGSSRPD